jgi:hypothetical protein
MSKFYGSDCQIQGFGLWFMWLLVGLSVYLSKMFERKHINMEFSIPQCAIYIVTYGSQIGRMIEMTI